MFTTAGRLADPERTEPGQFCPIVRSLQVLGTKAALVILREAAYGTSRYDDFVERTGLSVASVAARLSELTEVGVLEKVPYREPGSRTRFEYRLTETGEELIPALITLANWGNAHLPEKHSPSFTHAGCGEPIRPVLQCAGGHEISEGDVLVSA